MISEESVEEAPVGREVGLIAEEVKDAEKDASVEGARLELVPKVL